MSSVSIKPSSSVTLRYFFICRKCRTSNIGGTGDDDMAAAPASIRKELLITKSKKRKSKGRKSKGGDDSVSEDSI